MNASSVKTQEVELAGGSIGEGLVALGATTLGVLALIGILPGILVPIAAIGIGAAFFLEGGTIVRIIKKFVSESTHANLDFLSNGITAEIFAGITGIGLGILALLKIVPVILLPVVAIICGLALMVGGSITAKLNSMALDVLNEDDTLRDISHDTINAAANVRLLIGLGVTVLGILGVIGINPIILSTIAFLSIGFVNFLIDTAFSARMVKLFAH